MKKHIVPGRTLINSIKAERKQTCLPNIARANTLDESAHFSEDKHFLFRFCLYNSVHMGREHAPREKKLSMVNFLIFVHKNVSRIRFQDIKIRPLKGFEKMRFLCFYIIGI